MSLASEPLSPDLSSKLLELARACKAAARIVSMYPATHPAIQDALGRITKAGARAVAEGPLVMTVLPDTLHVGGQGLARPDPAVTELAAMLHAHSVGELRVLAPLEPAGWHAFLVLIAQTPSEVRDEGGIARAWASAGGGPLDVREIDYSEVLRERQGREDSEWTSILGAYLQGEQSDLNDSTLQAMVEVTADPARFSSFIDQLVEQTGHEWTSGQKTRLARLLQSLAAFVSRSEAGQLDRLLGNIADAIPHMSPEMVAGLLSEPPPVDANGHPQDIDLAAALLGHVDESMVAKFIAQSVARDWRATARLAQAFHSLIPDSAHRDRVLAAAAGVAANGPLGRKLDFGSLWRRAADILSSYSDEKYIPADYARDLSLSGAFAVEVDRIGDDPPERIAAWVTTISDEQVRRLDQQVLADLVLVETRPDEWRKVLGLTLGRIEELVLAGDLATAQDLLDTVLQVSRTPASPFAEPARTGVAQLAAGDVMTHALLILRQAEDQEMPRLTRFCTSLGTSVVGRLVDALLVEEGARTIRRLRDVLASFGSAARPRLSDLCHSPRAAVRRTAIELVKTVGGPGSLPLLLALLGDEELHVQREALRAIVQMESDDGFAALHKALTSGSPRTRDAITGALSSLRDERATPLFAYFVRQGQATGRFEKIYALALNALAVMRASDEATLAALRGATAVRAEWWNLWRTRTLRVAAVKALAAVGTPEAVAVLHTVAESGGFGARSAARDAVMATRRRGGAQAPARASGSLPHSSSPPARTASRTDRTGE